MSREEKKDSIFITTDAVQINNEIMDDVIYAYYKKGIKDPIVSALGRVIKDKYNVETHRDFINTYDAFEGGKLYIVKEMIDGEEDPIVYKQIAPTIRENVYYDDRNDNNLNDDVSEKRFEEGVLFAKNKRDYHEKITEINKIETETFKSMLEKANDLNKQYIDEINRLKLENFELKLKLDNEIWKNQFIKEKELEIEKQTEKELQKYQQTLNDNGTTNTIMSLLDKIAPILIEKFIFKDDKTKIKSEPTIPDIPTINEKDLQYNVYTNGVNSNDLSK